MPLYIKFGEKRGLVEPKRKYYVRFDTAYSIFSTIFNFIEKKDLKFTLFEDYPIPSISDKVETFDLNVGLIEKINTLRDELRYNSGFEITFDHEINDKIIHFIFTLLPNGEQSVHYDALLEVRPNGYVRTFMDVEKYIPDFRKIVKERTKKYNESKEKDVLYIDKAIISSDGKEIHSFNFYKFFYSRNAEGLITELIALSKFLKAHLLFADKERFAKEILGFNRFLLLMDTIANKKAISVSGGSITLIPDKTNSMSEFSSEIIKRLETFVEKAYPTTRKKYQEYLDDLVK